MKKLFLILFTLGAVCVLYAQQNKSSKSQADPRFQARLDEYKYVEQQLQHPNSKNQYNLAVQANPRDTRKLTMNGREFRMTQANTVHANGAVLYNTYEDPTTGDKIRVARLNGQLARDTWARVTGQGSNLEQGYKLETKMPVNGRKNEWIISASKGGEYQVKRYVKNPDGSVSILSASRGTADWNRQTFKRGTFQSVQNANMANLGQNMTTTSCQMGSDCY